MANVQDSRIISEDGAWEYQPGSLRPWKRIVDGANSGPGKPGVRETFQAAELARLQRIAKRKGE